jgi:hypothetical protein
MASQPLRIVFVPTELRGSGFFELMVSNLVFWGNEGIRGGSIKRFPEVVVLNSVGRRHVLDVLDTDEEAEERAAVIEGDLQILDIGEWCERYSVPLSFAEEHG